LGRLEPIDGVRANGWNRRVSPVAARFRDGLLSEPTAAAQLGRRPSCPEADLYVEFGSSHSRQRWGSQSAASDRSRSWVFRKSKSTGLVMNSAAPYWLARRRRSSSP